MCVAERQLRWFNLQADKELRPDADGVFRMKVFPGLWIHEAALFDRDYELLMKILGQGLATPEHQTFVKELESRLVRGKRGQQHPKRK